MEENFLLKIFPDHEVLLEINPEELGVGNPRVFKFNPNF